LINSIRVIGAGRVGAAVTARLRERGVVRETRDPELVLLCVPDAAIGEVAASVNLGPWVAHTSGATPLSTLAPHRRRFSIHPLQTFTHSRGAEQLDGAFAAVTSESREAEETGYELARILGLEPFALADDVRAVYHAGAVIASNYLVTLHRAASELFDEAGAPAAALEPLMTRTMENGFELTGPIARGDTTTVEAHLEAIRSCKPELEEMYRVLAKTTRTVVSR